jgi:circadian clock protein KaiC
LDEVLGGGFIAGGTYLLVGGPGTGKTVIANQICFERVRQGESCIYVTLLAESHSRMIANLQSFSFFEASVTENDIAYFSGARALRQGGLDGLVQLVQDEVHRRGASLLVVDGLRLGERAAGGDADHTSFLNRLGALLEFGNCTALLCSLASPDAVPAEYALADGLLELSHGRVGRRSVRELFVAKLRGSLGLDGSHVMEIDRRGAVVYPRMESRRAHDLAWPAGMGERCRFGVSGVDAMLHGGIPAASTTALAGAPGVGKTLLGLHFLAEGAKQGQRGLYFGFNESPARVIAQGEGIGLTLRRLCQDQTLDVAWRPSFEGLIDRIAHELIEHVRRREITRLFIDGVEGFARNSPFSERTHSVFTALSNELRTLGVTTLFSLETEILGARVLPVEPWSALFENAIALRYVELRSHLRRLIGIVKLSGSNFDSALREFAIAGSGIRVADSFRRVQAVLSGMARLEPPRSEADEGDER